MDEIKVSVVKFAGHKNLMLRYYDPVTRKQKHKSAKTTKRSEAAKIAGKWEEELRNGIAQPSKVTWATFRERYESEVLSTLAPATDQKVQGIFDAVEKLINPLLLRTLDADRLSVLQKALSDSGLAQSTIKTHLAHLLAALRWAESIGLLTKIPKVKMPERAKGAAMKGRPIAGEEFDRMIAAVPKLEEFGYSENKLVDPALVESWRHYLRGLWLSGLRLTESLQLSWDDETTGFMVDMQPGEHPMLKICAEAEKGFQDRLLPMSPEFAEFLEETPTEMRTGFVFTPQPRRKCGPRLGNFRVCELVSLIGKKAGVKVSTKAGKDGKPIVKYASAHDLRRSFGLRWASRVMPQVLMELMRHESIETTLKFYVGRNAQTTANVLWEAHRKAGSPAAHSSPEVYTCTDK